MSFEVTLTTGEPFTCERANVIHGGALEYVHDGRKHYVSPGRWISARATEAHQSPAPVYEPGPASDNLFN